MEQQKLTKDFQKILNQFQAVQKEASTRAKQVVEYMHQVQEE